jgi:hypothetical protein
MPAAGRLAPPAGLHDIGTDWAKVAMTSFDLPGLPRPGCLVVLGRLRSSQASSMRNEVLSLEVRTNLEAVRAALHSSPA